MYIVTNAAYVIKNEQTNDTPGANLYALLYIAYLYFLKAQASIL